MDVGRGGGTSLSVTTRSRVPADVGVSSPALRVLWTRGVVSGGDRGGMDVFVGLPASAPATPVAMRGVLDDSPRGVDGGCGSSSAHTPPLPGSVDGALPDFPDALHSPLTFTAASPPRGLGGPGGGPLGGGVDVFGLQRHPPLSTVLYNEPYGGGDASGRGGGAGSKAASPPFMQLPSASAGSMGSAGVPLFPPMPPLTVTPVAGATGGVGGCGGGNGGPDVDGLGGCPPRPAAPAAPASWFAKAWAGATAGPPPPLSGLAAGLATVNDVMSPSADDFDLTAALGGTAAGVGNEGLDCAGGVAASASMQVSPMSPFVVGHPLPSLDDIGSVSWGGVRGSVPLPVDVPMAVPRRGAKRGGNRAPAVGPAKGAIGPAAVPAGISSARSGAGSGVGMGVAGGGNGSGSCGPASKITKKSGGGSKKKKKKKSSSSGGGGAVAPQGQGAGAAAVAAAAAGSRRPRTYTAPVPSMHCHNCSRRPSAESPHYACSNLAVGLCRKTICRRCIYVHGDASAEGLPGMGSAPFPLSSATSPAASIGDPGRSAGRPGVGGGDDGRDEHGGGRGHGGPALGGRGTGVDSRGGGSGKDSRGGGGGGGGGAKSKPPATNGGVGSRDGGDPAPSSGSGNPLVIGGDSSSTWVCFHCRGVCPPRAQCHTYARTTVRRRLGQVKHRKPKTAAAVTGGDGPQPTGAASGGRRRAQRGSNGSPAASGGTAPRSASGSAAPSSGAAGRLTPVNGSYNAMDAALPVRPPPPKGGRTSRRARASGGAAARGAAAAAATPSGRVGGGGSGGGGSGEAGRPAASAANDLLLSSTYPLGERGADLAALSQSLIASPDSWSTASMSVEVGSTLPGGPLGGLGLHVGDDDDHPLLLASLDVLARVGDGVGVGGGSGDGGVGGIGDSGTLLAASLSAAAALDSPDGRDLYFPLGVDGTGVGGGDGFAFGVPALL